MDEHELRTCGHYCFPATNPGNGVPSFDCAHDANAHYDIDGESTGCSDCEEERSDAMEWDRPIITAGATR